MTDSGKKFYVTDANGNYYKLGSKGKLVKVNDSSKADVFSIREANRYIGGGYQAKKYSMIEAASDTYVNVVEPNPVYSVPKYNEEPRPVMFDTLDNNWEGRLSELYYLSSHVDEYYEKLNSMLSDVDKEVCDILHYLELRELTEAEMIEASRMLQERRRHRRKIKNEMEKIEMMKATFLNKEFGIKVHESMEQFEHMKFRQYTPRKLGDLFNKSVSVSA